MPTLAVDTFILQGNTFGPSPPVSIQSRHGGPEHHDQNFCTLLQPCKLAGVAKKNFNFLFKKNHTYAAFSKDG
jgi:hypothetical protein